MSILSLRTALVSPPPGFSLPMYAVSTTYPSYDPPSPSRQATNGGERELSATKGKRKTTICCANCGGIGHVYKNCNHPVTSYGLICYRLTHDDASNSVYPEYLMVQRKDSMSYVEFIRGKYKLENRSYLTRLFMNMTGSELERLKTRDFSALWKDLWQSPTCQHFAKEFNEALHKFNALRRGFYMKRVEDETTMFFSLDYLIQQTTPRYSETEWGFPKGRRNINEDDTNCALREFNEETGYLVSSVRIHCDIKPVEEVFSGTNNIRYKHIYYIAQMLNHETHPRSPRAVSQSHEIRSVGWFKYHDAQALIRDYNVERKELFRRVNQMIMRSIYHQSWVPIILSGAAPSNMVV